MKMQSLPCNPLNQKGKKREGCTRRDRADGCASNRTRRRKLEGLLACRNGTAVSCGNTASSEAGNLGTPHLHHLDSRRLQFLAGLGPLGRVNSPCAFLDHVRLEPLLGRVDGGAANAVVPRQAHDVHVRDLLLPQRRREPAVVEAGVSERVVESAVHLDLGMGALFDDRVDAREIEFGDQLGPGRVLDAMVGPQPRLVLLVRVERVRNGGEVDKRLLALVVGGKGYVIGRMPVLGSDPDDEGGQREEGVDGARDVAPSRDGQRAVLSGTRERMYSSAGPGGFLRTGQASGRPGGGGGTTHRRAEVLLKVDDDQRGSELVRRHLEYELAAPHRVTSAPKRSAAAATGRRGTRDTFDSRGTPSLCGGRATESGGATRLIILLGTRNGRLFVCRRVSISPRACSRGHCRRPVVGQARYLSTPSVRWGGVG